MKNERIWLSAVIVCAVAALGAECGGKICEAQPASGSMRNDFRLPTPAVPEGSTAYLDAKNGFRDLQFGGAVTPDMKRAEKQDSDLTESYVRLGDSLEVGPGQADEIRYVFFAGGLSKVIIETSGRENGRAIRNEMLALFGEVSVPGYPFDIWRGERAVATYQEVDEDHAILGVWSPPMMGKVLAAVRARTAAAETTTPTATK